MKRAAVALALLIWPGLAGCNTTAQPITQSNFTAPYYQATIFNSMVNCYQIYVAASVLPDSGPAGSGQGWEEVQCNISGFSYFQTQTLTAAQMMEIADAFDALPATPDTTCSFNITPAGAMTSLQQETAAGVTTTWDACLTSGDGGTQLTEPYANAVDLLQAFVQTPQTLVPDQ